MHTYFIWPGAYDFKQELGLLLQYVKDEIDRLLLEIANAQTQIR